MCVRLKHTLLNVHDIGHGDTILCVFESLGSRMVLSRSSADAKEKIVQKKSKVLAVRCKLLQKVQDRKDSDLGL